MVKPRQSGLVLGARDQNWSQEFRVGLEQGQSNSKARARLGMELEQKKGWSRTRNRVGAKARLEQAKAHRVHSHYQAREISKP